MPASAAAASGTASPCNRLEVGHAEFGHAIRREMVAREARLSLYDIWTAGREPDPMASSPMLGLIHPASSGQGSTATAESRLGLAAEDKVICVAESIGSFAMFAPLMMKPVVPFTA